LDHPRPDGLDGKHFQQRPRLAPPRRRLLLAHALNCKRIELYTRWDEVVNNDGRDRFRELVKRRSKVPGDVPDRAAASFYTLEFEVTPAVLIPAARNRNPVTETVKRIKDLPSPRSSTSAPAPAASRSPSPTA